MNKLKIVATCISPNSLNIQADIEHESLINLMLAKIEPINFIPEYFKNENKSEFNEAFDKRINYIANNFKNQWFFGSNFIMSIFRYTDYSTDLGERLMKSIQGLSCIDKKILSTNLFRWQAGYKYWTGYKYWNDSFGVWTKSGLKHIMISSVIPPRYSAMYTELLIPYNIMEILADDDINQDSFEHFQYDIKDIPYEKLENLDSMLSTIIRINPTIAAQLWRLNEGK